MRKWEAEGRPFPPPAGAPQVPFRRPAHSGSAREQPRQAACAYQRLQEVSPSLNHRALNSHSAA
jgi:hypothetical protein